MRFDIEIETAASPGSVWAVLVDVERWPERGCRGLYVRATAQPGPADRRQ